MACSCAGGTTPTKTGTQSPMQRAIAGMGENDIVIHQGLNYRSDAVCRTLCHDIIVRCLKLPNEITVEDGTTIASLVPGDKFILSGLSGCVEGWCGVIESANPTTRSIKVTAPFDFLKKDTSYSVGSTGGGSSLASLAGCATGAIAQTGGRPELNIMARSPVTQEGFLVVENGKQDLTLQVRGDAGSDVFMVKPTGVVKVGMTLSVDGFSAVVKEQYSSKGGFDIFRLDKLSTETYECKLGGITSTAIPFSFEEDACGCVSMSLSWQATEKIVAASIKGCAEPVKVGRYMTYEVSGKGTTSEFKGGCVEHGCVWVIPGIDSSTASLSAGGAPTPFSC